MSIPTFADCTADGTIAWISQACPPLTVEDVVGTRCYDYYQGEWRDKLARAVERCLAGRTVPVLSQCEIGGRSWLFRTLLFPRELEINGYRCAFSSLTWELPLGVLDLSPLQKRLLEEYGRLHSVKLAAGACGVNYSTARRHFQIINERLGVHDSRDLLAVAIRML